MYVVLDFETTGLNYKTDQVTEIGAIKLDDNFVEVGSFHTFVKLKDGNKVSEFTDITEEQMATGMEEGYALNTLRTFIGDCIVVAQWIPFDLAFLDYDRKITCDFYCTKSITSLNEPEETSSLGPTCERLGIELVNAHRALDDARATAELFRLYMNSSTSIKVPKNTLVVSDERPMNFVPKSTEYIYIKGGGLIYTK